MDTKRLLELARNPEHIPGIYNYCDRWCESCDHQGQCLQFAVEREMDDPNKSSVESISDSLETTVELLGDMAREHGLELPETEDSLSSSEEDTERLFRQAQSDDLIQKARRYSIEASARMQALQGSLEAAADAVARKVDLEVSAERGWGIRDLEKLGEAGEAILRYRHLIRGKLLRAVLGTCQASDDPDDGSQDDAVRSAGVAWRAIQRSIDSWVTIYRFCPAHSAGILQILLLLDRLRRDVELRFPAGGM